MTADGVMPPRSEQARFTDVGSVESLGGLPLHVHVSGGAVIVAGHYLNAAHRKVFAALFVDACTIADDETTP